MVGEGKLPYPSDDSTNTFHMLLSLKNRYVHIQAQGNGRIFEKDIC